MSFLFITVHKTIRNIHISNHNIDVHVYVLELHVAAFHSSPQISLMSLRSMGCLGESGDRYDRPTCTGKGKYRAKRNRRTVNG